MTREKVIQILSGKKGEWKERFGIEKIAIFGSFARGEEKKDSDIDLYVEFEMGRINLKSYMAFIEEIEILLGRKVDVITKAGKETIRIPYIKESIDRDLTYV